MRGDITFIKGQGASKRVAAGEDYISGLVFYTDDLPSGFTYGDNIKQIFSVVQAESLGIVSDYSDETKAIGHILISTEGVVGDTIKVTTTEPLGASSVLVNYTLVSGDTTDTILAINLAAAINLNTKTTGYTAAADGDVVDITAKKGLGVFNTTLTASTTGTLVVSTVSFSGGVASQLAIWHYHVSEYFRTNTSGNLWVGFFPLQMGYTFGEITTLQNAAAGKIRQIGVFKAGTYDIADFSIINAEVLTYNDAEHKPLSVLYAADLWDFGPITAVLPDLSELSANKVSSIVGQDGAGLGAYLFATSNKSITNLGAALGTLSKSAVSEDFGEPAKFNISNGIENGVPAFANGQLVSDPTIGKAGLDLIDSNRHIFGQTYIGYAGTYFNDNHTAISTSSDYAYINDNRVIDKATRGVYTALIPYLKSKLLKNADGTLARTTVKFLEGQALEPLYQMSRDQDLGEVVASDVYIDPTQNVTSTSELIVNILLNENGIARNIVVPIAFK